MKFLIAGLGNIGVEYELTRHNIGFLTLDQLADKFNVSFASDRLAHKCNIKYKGRSIHLIKPTTYMNLSGKAINYWLTKLKIPKKNLLVVTDDTALPFGKLRMREKGSDAGHNGLKNIEMVTGGNDYPRLRFGIGNNFFPSQKTDYVLGKFSTLELEQLADTIENANQMILSYTTIGVERTMNFFN